MFISFQYCHRYLSYCSQLINVEQVALWFRETNKFLTAFYKQTIPSLAFYHIPVQAMAAFQTEGVNANQEPGINDDNPLAQQGQETTEDGDVYYDGADIPFMQALVDTPGLMATFSGHDHGDDWYVFPPVSPLLSHNSWLLGVSSGTVLSRI